MFKIIKKGLKKFCIVKVSTYEEKTDSYTQSFWKDIPEEHPFSKHRILSTYGDILSKESYEHTKSKNKGLAPEEIHQVLQQILEIEQNHKGELEELAKKVTQSIWGIDISMLDAKLGSSSGAGSKEEKVEPAEITPELQKEINKRITLNTMTQGSAVHAMLTMHYIIDKEIEAISPELLDLYSKFAAGSHYGYWLMNIPSIIQNIAAGQIGEEEIEFESENIPKVKAVGLCFPVLCQELSKGVMELLTMHGLSKMNERELTTVYENADRHIDEPWLIQVGPELWRKFLKIIPANIKLADLVANFSRKSPDYVQNFIEKVINFPEGAIESISEMMEDTT